MGWFSNSSNDNDAIRSQIRDLESDLRYLEREASDARNKSEKYWDDYKCYSKERGDHSDWRAEDAIRESNYWGNVNYDIQSKIDALEDKIRDLEREL